jgi:PAS domain S-box-containing protein
MSRNHPGSHEQSVQSVQAAQNHDFRPEQHMEQLSGSVTESLELYHLVLSNISDTVFLTDRTGVFTFVSPNVKHLFGYTPKEVWDLGSITRLLGDDLVDWQQLDDRREPYLLERDILDKSGTPHTLAVTVKRLAIKNGTILYSCRDISDHKQTEATLQQQVDREHLLSAIAQHIRQSLDLETILQTTVADIRDVLQSDRVLIYRFEADWSGIVAVESVVEPWTAVLGTVIHDDCFSSKYIQPYIQGRVQVTSDIYTSNLTPCYVDLLSTFQVRANLVVPIMREKTLWGLLIAHHCRGSRTWQSVEVDLLKQLATQVGIAIQQSELYQRLQRLNAGLEHQIEVRTAQLQQSLDFEARLKRITDKVRDSLDEAQILQTAVQELGLGLGVKCCDTALYNAEKTSATIYCDYTVSMPSAQGQTANMNGLPETYSHLLRGQYVQFCPLSPNSIRPTWGQTAILACPIMHQQNVLGDLWLFKDREEAFNDVEVRLVQQVANQCAIALHQAHLYRTAQAQVEDLARLNRMKDDFLSTVSHELRTPMSNIKLATEMLEIMLFQSNRPTALAQQENGMIQRTTDEQARSAAVSGITPTTLQKVNRYFQILKDECQREISLINDLLDLSRLDAGTEPLILTSIDLALWIHHFAEPFRERVCRQQQELTLNLPTTLPLLTTDLSYLERALAELLNNACKYTPPGETITLSAGMVEDGTKHIDESPCLYLCVSNSGVEIPEQERDRIFDKFYRIPHSDPWKHGGTGLGLALVKKIVEHLGAKIRVDSTAGETTFTIEFPYPTMVDAASST